MVGEQITGEKFDPDWFAILNLAVAVAAVVAQVTDLKFPIQKKRHKPPKVERPTKERLDFLADASETAVRDLVKLLKIIQSTKDDRGIPSGEANFRYGESKALLSLDEFQALARLTNQVALNSGTVCTWILSLIRFDEDIADLIGEKLVQIHGDVSRLIRHMYSREMSNELVLNNSIALIRSLLATLKDLQNAGN